MKSFVKIGLFALGITCIGINAYSLTTDQQENTVEENTKSSASGARYFVIQWTENHKVEGGVSSYDVVTNCMSGGNQPCQKGRYTYYFKISTVDIAE